MPPFMAECWRPLAGNGGGPARPRAGAETSLEEINDAFIPISGAVGLGKSDAFAGG